MKIGCTVDLDIYSTLSSYKNHLRIDSNEKQSIGHKQPCRLPGVILCDPAGNGSRRPAVAAPGKALGFLNSTMDK